jgi:geranylgeranyl pyrophosphate synthase
MFELATTASALLSPMCEDALEPVRSFGYGIGMAFQIVDDVLDFSGEQEIIGKPVASDLRQGLITLPTIYYLESEPDDPDLSLALNGILYDETRLTRLTHAIRSSGAIEKSIKEAGQHVAKALDALEDLPQNVEHQALEDLANYVIQRHY